MSKSRPRSKRRKNHRHRQLTPIQKNEVVVLREMGYQYKDICKKTQLAYGTVYDIVKKAQSDPEAIKKARGEALLRAASDTYSVALKARDAITEESLRHDVVEVRDEDGNLTNVRHFGQSALQNATTFGILTDKAMKLQERGEVLTSGQQSMLSPDNIAGMVMLLRDRVKRITLTADFGGEDIRETLLQKLDSMDGEAQAEFEELGDHHTGDGV